MSTNVPFWKLAASLPPDDDTEALEKAFSDAAFAQAQLRCKPLMQPPFRIGFEIVYSNAPENTRLVGVFAFRVDDEILLVPSCFVDGRIQGQELIYREKRKKFVPLSEEWAQFLVSRKDQSNGVGVSKPYSRRHPSRADLGRLSTPPYAYHKVASENDRTLIQKVAKEMFEVIGAAKSDMSKEANVFEEFLHLAGPGGEVALQAFATACEKSAKFNDIAYGTGMLSRFEKAAEAYFTKQLKQEKAASAPDLVLVSGVKLSSVPADRRDAYIRDGYYIQDNRKEASEATVKFAATYNLVDGEVEHKVINNHLPDIQALNQPGVYEVLMADGGSEMARAFGVSDSYVCDYDQRNMDYPNAVEPYACGKGDRTKRKMVAITDSGKIIDARSQMACGHLYDALMGQRFTEGKKIGEIKTGEDYLLSIGGETFPCTFRFKRIQDNDGVYYARAIQTSFGEELQPKEEPSWDRSKGLLLNPDIPSRASQGVIGQDATFWPVASKDNRVECALHLDDADLTQSLYANEIELTGKVKHEGKDVVFSFPELAHGSGSIRLTSKAAACAYLCRAHGVPAEVAQEAVRMSGEFRIPKMAMSLPISPVSDPYWTQSFDPSLQVQTEGTQYFNIPTYQDKIPAPTPHLNDGWDPTLGRGMLLSKSPMELAQFARENEIPSLMDHSSVAGLLKVYDIGSLVDRMIPRMEEALDVLGRLYFLIQWKPEEFATMYGDTDVTSKTEEFLSNFKSFGDVVLDLSKRSRELENKTDRSEMSI